MLAGGLHNSKVHENSFAAEVGFSQRMSDYASWSAEYYNEGHPSQHHRDGFTSQIWLHTPYPEKGASFGLGVGPYYYFDTTTGLGSATDYRNLHGWGTLYSAGAKWHFEKRSYVEVRINHARTHGEGDSNSILVGLGYELQNVPDRERRKTERPGDRLLMVQAGQAIVNSFESERARAYGIEYRDTVTQNVEWSVTALNEGRVGLVERKGAAAQLWLLRPLTDRTVLELGTGGYLMRDRINRDSVTEPSKTHLGADHHPGRALPRLAPVARPAVVQPGGDGLPPRFGYLAGGRGPAVLGRLVLVQQLLDLGALFFRHVAAQGGQHQSLPEPENALRIRSLSRLVCRESWAWAGA